jgi:hypothetical protein
LEAFRIQNPATLQIALKLSSRARGSISSDKVWADIAVSKGRCMGFIQSDPAATA